MGNRREWTAEEDALAMQPVKSISAITIVGRAQDEIKARRQYLQSRQYDARRRPAADRKRDWTGNREEQAHAATRNHLKACCDALRDATIRSMMRYANDNGVDIDSAARRLLSGADLFSPPEFIHSDAQDVAA